MKAIIAGASGLVGQALSNLLKGKGYEVMALRRPEGWNPEEGMINFSLLEGSDVIINLAGESIMGFWTAAKKKKIHDSRVKSTQVIVDAINRLNNPPKLLINASAIGFYGDSGSALVNESDAPGSNFLASVVKDWEAAASKASCRTVYARFGVVLSKKGGALKQMLIPFKLGLGGVLGSGEQYMSYIALSDLINALYFIIQHPDIKGPVNIVAEEPVTNREFTKTLGKVLNRPTFFPVPEFAVKAIFGEMGKELFLASERVNPSKLKSAGFKWNTNNLEACLSMVLSD